MMRFVAVSVLILTAELLCFGIADIHSWGERPEYCEFDLIFLEFLQL